MKLLKCMWGVIIHGSKPDFAFEIPIFVILMTNMAPRKSCLHVTCVTISFNLHISQSNFNLHFHGITTDVLKFNSAIFLQKILTHSLSLCCVFLQIHSVEDFVCSVNAHLTTRQENERLKGIMARIESYDIVVSVLLNNNHVNICTCHVYDIYDFFLFLFVFSCDLGHKQRVSGKNGETTQR